MKKIIPDEGTAIKPLGWYDYNFQTFRVYEITCGGELTEIHLLDMTLFVPEDHTDLGVDHRGAPYVGPPR